ncbi:EAL domain-containing protein [Novosphingobium rhizovicinum]|uniref:EAL domain-containing protein n=1 Tax=Novosphingobium rhizovicinum TaxID=3228928 RepID=A0ABV3RE81_9SPHN
MTVMQRLALIVLFAAIPIGILQALSVQRQERVQQEAVARVAKAIAYRAGAEQRRIVEGARQLLAGIAQLPAVQDGDPQACNLILRRLGSQFPMYTAIGVASPKGHVWCSSTRAGTDVSDRAYFKQALATRQFGTGGYIVGRVLGVPTLNFTLPFEDESGELTGVLIAGLDLDRLADDLGKARLPVGSNLMIYGPDRRQLVDLPYGTRVGKQLPPVLEQAFRSKEPGSVEIGWVDGRQRILAYYPPSAIAEVPFLVAVSVDREDALAQVGSDARRAWVVLGLVLAAALLGAWWFAARYVRRPLKQLALTVRAWRAGDGAARVGHLEAGSEFDDLARAFDALADSVVERQERLQSALENTTDSVAIVAPDWTVTFLNGNAINQMHRDSDLIGRSIWEIYPDSIDQPVGRGLISAMTERRRVVVTFENEEMGEYFETNAYPADDGGLILFSRNVTEERRAQQKLQRLALCDPLTDLANRSHATEIGSQAAADGALSALLILDLDHFKHVNDTLGHPAGDDMLREVARRLLASVQDRAFVARLGGDEFVVIMREMTPASCIELAREILEALERDVFSVRDRAYDVTASAGLVLVDQSRPGIEELMANADLALYRAKAEGGATYCTYTSADRDAYRARRQLEDEVALGAVNGEFELFYQPQVNLKTGTLVGAEALLRWHHSSRGLLLPGDFMDVLGASRHAVTAGTWVIEEACRQASVWWRSGMRLRVSVNLFAQQLSTGNLPQIIQTILRRHSLPAHALELEVTENITLTARPDVKRTLLTLHMLGVRLAFDDFGTGFASLTTLKDLPVNRLKIDRSFVTHLPEDEEDKAIVEAVLALARTLRLEVVAEGVETDEQAEYLRSRGCSEAQGFLYGRPMAGPEFTATMCNIEFADEASIPLTQGAGTL